MTNEMGSRIADRRAGQVDPEVAERAAERRARPRIRAAARHMPTAADTKFCTARPAIWTRWPMVDSPEYDCQFVLVTKLTAVLNAIFGIDVGEAVRQRQPGLHPLEHVEHQHRHEAEGEDGDGVDVPALLPLRVDAQEAVDQPFDRAEHPVTGGLSPSPYTFAM